MFEFFGCLGGTLVVIDYIIKIIMVVIKAFKDYYMKKGAEEERHKAEEEKITTMGFKTKKEQEEIEARLQMRKRA